MSARQRHAFALPAAQVADARFKVADAQAGEDGLGVRFDGPGVRAVHLGAGLGERGLPRRVMRVALQRGNGLFVTAHKLHLR